jgi:L,D-peptidoglycan transpeptidase YkuD (ErfK/YbiS/YcfS/YnhG family)
MIIINKSGYLKYENLKFRCAVGKNGIKKKVKEGDNITPKGKYKIINLLYRADKLKKVKTALKKIKIKKNMVWCDDIRSKFYNKLTHLPNNYSHEKLFRNDNIYDLILVLNYNSNPIIKGKGSAIFIHVAKKKFARTRGCIALQKKDLLTLLRNIKKNTTIKIG